MVICGFRLSGVAVLRFLLRLPTGSLFNRFFEFGITVNARMIGVEAGRWSEQMLEHRGVEGVRVLMGLLNLAQRHPGDVIDQACEIAASHGAYRLRTIKELIKRQGNKQEQFDFLAEHPLIRSLSDYGSLVSTAFDKEEWS